MHIATTYRLEVCKGHLCLMPSCGRVRVAFMYNLRVTCPNIRETTVVQKISHGHCTLLDDYIPHLQDFRADILSWPFHCHTIPLA